jgi:hypothetical protein
MNLAEQEAKTKASKKRGFEDFMSNPLTCMVVSTIPAGENKDGLEQLLKAAYESGYSAGMAETIIELATAIFAPTKGDRNAL